MAASSTSTTDVDLASAASAESLRSGGSSGGTGTASASASSAGSSTGSVARRKVALLRLASDLRRLSEDSPPGISASPMTEDNIFQWNASIVGPDETPWEGGIFSLRLQFPDQYPDKPPKIRFICDIFHPNVYPDGSICLDIIQDLWKPIYTVDMLLTSIQSLLTDPNVDSPANIEAARLFRTDMKQYKRRVRRMAAKTIE